MPQLFKLFGSIQKIEEQEDGTIKVYGVASSESRDSAGEIISAAAMADALPDYSKFPALREMHQPMAAGKVLEADVNADGITEICAHVVDPVAITKVKTETYKGFSIGGKVLSRDPKDRSIITGLKLVEISLVDSPCNPDAQLTMWKADLMPEFKPSSADVIARAKDLAKAARTQRFKDFLFEASQELIAAHLIEKGEIGEPEADPAAPGAGESDPAPEANADPAPELEAEPGESDPAGGEIQASAEAEPISGDPDEDDHAGEGADEPAAGSGEGKEAAAQADPAAALSNAIAAGQAALEAADAAPEAADPFADLGKAGLALKGISLGEGEPLAKGMWEISRFADLLCSFACVQSSLAWEAENEGDQSPIPAQLADAIGNLGNILVAAVKEEVAELVAGLKRPEGEAGIEIVYVGEEILLAEQIVDLIKADEALIGPAGERLAKRAAPEGEDPAAAIAEKDARIEILEGDLAKANEALAGAAPQIEGLTKGFTDQIDGLKGQISDLEKRFSDLDQTPLPPKTAGPGRVVAKSQDAEGNGGSGGDEGAPLTAEEFKKAFDALPEAERGKILMKVALSRPHLVGQPG